nr:hypothetical protein Hi04_10k_c2220_00028 [uncultured bacterium]
MDGVNRLENIFRELEAEKAKRKTATDEINELYLALAAVGLRGPKAEFLRQCIEVAAEAAEAAEAKRK